MLDIINNEKKLKLKDNADEIIINKTKDVPNNILQIKEKL
jgi:hypothetical protein